MRCSQRYGCSVNKQHSTKSATQSFYVAFDERTEPPNNQPRQHGVRMFKAAAVLMLVAAVYFLAAPADTERSRAENQAAIARISTGAAEPKKHRSVNAAQDRLDTHGGSASNQASAEGGGDAMPADTSDAMKRATLVRSIQTELTRLGCFSGEIDAQWSADTRHAMRMFNTRIDATLPVEKPDYILLTLLRGQSAAGCGRQCPAGQDSCVPVAMTADVLPGSASLTATAPAVKQPLAKVFAQAAQRRPATSQKSRPREVAVARLASPPRRAVVRAAEYRAPPQQRQQRAEPTARSARASSPGQESSGSFHERVFRNIAMNAP